jgi:tetratricopeptide (TPR) repeat protein
VNARTRLALGGVLVVAGAALMLLGADVRRVGGSMRESDTRFALAPADGDLWSPTQLVPFGPAEKALRLEDDLAYRRAVRVFVLAKPREQPYSETDVIAQRGRAQELLEELVDSDDNPTRRSAASNLIGALGFANAALDASAATSYLQDAVEDFQTAIVIDPENDDAKYNLELALERLEAARESSDEQPPPPDTRGGSGAGAGTGRPGTGY